MLQITIPAAEMWDERIEEFIYAKEQTIQLEHSLLSLSKWESKWGKPFLSKNKLTDEETLDYIRCMTVTPNIHPDTYARLSKENIDQIVEYIHAPMTATTFREDPNAKKSREVITAELIYYWMITAGIPNEYQKWHLNKLITLIRVCGIKNAPPKKMSKSEIMRRNSAINASRLAQLNSRG